MVNRYNLLFLIVLGKKTSSVGLIIQQVVNKHLDSSGLFGKVEKMVKSGVISKVFVHLTIESKMYCYK